MIELGFIRAAHGLKGHVVVHLYSREEDSLTAYGDLTNADGSKTYKIDVISVNDKDFLCRVEGITERNGAEALRGTKLYIPAANLPETEDEDAFYIRDLIDLEVRDTVGTVLGKVINIIGVAAHDALEIEFTHNGAAPLAKPVQEYLVFTKDNVPDVHIADGYITINLPYGLLETVDKAAK